MLKQIWKVFAALRNSYDLFIDHISEWIIEVTVWKPLSECPDAEGLQRLWELLGVDLPLSELIAHELRLHWDFENGHLCVSSEWQKKEGSMQELASTLLALWHFKLFSDSRWLTIGISCRTLVVALLTGLPTMIKFLKAKGVSEFHLGGGVAWTLQRRSSSCQQHLLLMCLMQHCPSSSRTLALPEVVGKCKRS